MNYDKTLVEKLWEEHIDTGVSIWKLEKREGIVHTVLNHWLTRYLKERNMKVE